MACEILGAEKPDHVGNAEVERRIGRLSDEALVAFLAPLAAMTALSSR